MPTQTLPLHHRQVASWQLILKEECSVLDDHLDVLTETIRFEGDSDGWAGAETVDSPRHRDPDWREVEILYWGLANVDIQTDGGEHDAHLLVHRGGLDGERVGVAGQHHGEGPALVHSHGQVGAVLAGDEDLPGGVVRHRGVVQLVVLVVPEVPLVVLEVLVVLPLSEDSPQSHAEMEHLLPALLELSSASMDLHFTAVLELALLVLLALLLAQLADLSLALDLD